MAHLENMAAIRAAGGFVHAPRKRLVTWEGVNEETGEPFSHTFDIYMVPQNMGWSLRQAKDVPDGKDPLFYRLSQMLMMPNDQGTPELVSYEDACTFDPGMGNAILSTINEANAPKNSTPRTNSSATSSLPESSVATP